MTHPALDTAAWVTANPDEHLLIVEGVNVSITVRGGCLEIKDGTIANPRTRTLQKVDRRRVKQILIIDYNGYMSMGAMRWLADNEIEWSVLDNSDNEERLPRTLGTGGHWVDAELMRVQAQAVTGGPLESTGLLITQRLITRKLEGQADNAERQLDNPHLAKFIREQIESVWLQDNIEKIRGPEGRAAEAQWKVWKGAELTWRKPAPVAKGWKAYPGRKSYWYAETNDDNRNATDPVNAMLNWGYKVAETMVSHAIAAHWLSPVMGISHTDRKKRDSFALDVIEPMRPVVDGIVWEVMQEPMHKAWFTESPRGLVRCRAPLTHRIASAVRASRWVVEQDMAQIVKTLAEAA